MVARIVVKAEAPRAEGGAGDVVACLAEVPMISSQLGAVVQALSAQGPASPSWEASVTVAVMVWASVQA